MKSSPIEESRKIALASAQKLIETEGWNCLTASRIAEDCGLSRQWLHSLFGSQQGLIDSLVKSLVGDWRSAQLEVVAARFPITETLEKSFLLLLNSPASLGIVFREQLVEPALNGAIWPEVERLWSPVWQSERAGTAERNSSVTMVFFAGALGLEALVRRGKLRAKSATGTLIASVKGALR